MDAASAQRRLGAITSQLRTLHCSEAEAALDGWLSVVREHGPAGPALRRALASASARPKKVRIGDVAFDVVVPLPGSEALVPSGYLAAEESGQDVLRVLRFIMQKDVLGQDVYLIGPPGPVRRQIAMKYCELTSRQVEYVALSHDTTETDLKQRREIVAGTPVSSQLGARPTPIEAHHVG